MELNGLMGGFYRISEWLMRFSVINLLWVFTAFPFAFFAFFLLFGNGPYPPLLFWLAIFTPIFFFPSTAAVFTTVRKWIIGQEDAPLIRTFFRGYWENYRQSFLGGLFYLLLGGILGGNTYFYWTQSGFLQVFAYLMGFFLLLLFLSLPFFFSMMVHLQLTFLALIKNVFFITMISPFKAILLLGIHLLILYLSIFHLTFLLPFFTVSLLSFISYFFFHGTYMRIMKKEGFDDHAEENLNGTPDDETKDKTGDETNDETNDEANDEAKNKPNDKTVDGMKDQVNGTASAKKED